MIVDIPSPEDFETTAASLLNLAWSTASSLLFNAEEARLSEWDNEGQITDEFWSAAQQPLGNAQALVQQGVEFLLKARIAEVSPFLLLDRSVRDWPKDSSNQDTKYAEFRTVDAQDLMRIFNTVRTERLDAAFVKRIDDHRKKRNAFTHSIDKSCRYSPDAVWTAILDVCHHLVAPLKWIDLRRTYLESTPTSVAFGADPVAAQLAWEGMTLIERLSPADQRTYLGISPKVRRYICFSCAMECRDAEFLPDTAQLKPNQPTSKNAYCFVCKTNQPVVRTPCKSNKCKGNVIVEHELFCLTCFEDQERIQI